MTQSKDEKVVIDVRITDVGTLPPQYFTHDAVVAALRDVVRSDVVVHGNDVPPGAEAIKGHPRGPMAQSAAKRQLTFELKHAVKRDWPLFLVIWLSVVSTALILWLLGVL